MHTPASIIKNLLIVALFLSICTLVVSQVKPPQITPLSPNAAALYKYTELPVNTFTGIPSIAIPLYEIKSGSLSVPVTLNYHAGGIRYEEQASWVGLAWSLQAGGAINRNVQGYADEKSGGILTQSIPLNQNIQQCDYPIIDYVAKGYIDMAPDEFSYSMPGKTGRYNYQAGVLQPITIPYQPLKFTNTSSSSGISKIEIQDENGTMFRYGNYKNINSPVLEFTSGGAGIYTEDLYPTTWLMTEIETPDLKHNVTFNYTPGGAVQKNSKYDHIDVLDFVTGGSAEGSPCTPPSANFGNALTQNLTYFTNTNFLSEILFENGKLQFVQSTNYRIDINNNQRSLEYIKVYAIENNIYKLIKSYKFIYSYFKKYDNGILKDWKLKLDAIQVLDSDGIVQEAYGFQYHTTIFSGTNNVADMNSQDYWGFYNGKANANLIPAQSVEYSPVGTTPMYYPVGGDRNVDPTFMTEGVLKRITYPTKGYTEFEYETHKYQEVSQTKYAGGLRIKKVTSVAPESALPLVKSYKYGPNYNGFGNKNFSNYLGTYNTQTWTHCMNSLIKTGTAIYRVRSFNSMSSMQIDGYDGSPVIYPYVTEFIGDEITNNGRTEYVFDGGFPTSDNYYLYYSSVSNVIRRQSNDYLRGKLTSKIIYTAQNTKVSATSTTYQTLQSSNQLTGFSAQQRYNYPVEDLVGCYTYDGQTKYSQFYYPTRSGAVLPLTTTETVYDASGTQKGVSNTTQFTFDPIYLQPTEIQRTAKQGENGYQEILTTYNKYPFNYSFTGAPSGNEALGIKNLQNNNVFSVPIEKYTSKKIINGTVDTKVINGSITTFKPSLLYPDKVWQLEISAPIAISTFGSGSTISANAFSKNAAYNQKLVFDNYDLSGNITELHKEKTSPPHIYGVITMHIRLQKSRTQKAMRFCSAALRKVQVGMRFMLMIILNPIAADSVEELISFLWANSPCITIMNFLLHLPLPPNSSIQVGFTAMGLPQTFSFL